MRRRPQPAARSSRGSRVKQEDPRAEHTRGPGAGATAAKHRRVPQPSGSGSNTGLNKFRGAGSNEAALPSSWSSCAGLQALPTQYPVPPCPPHTHHYTHMHHTHYTERARARHTHTERERRAGSLSSPRNRCTPCHRSNVQTLSLTCSTWQQTQESTTSALTGWMCVAAGADPPPQ